MKAAQSKAPRKRVARNNASKRAAAKMVRPSRTPLAEVKKRARDRYDELRRLHLRDGKNFTEIAQIESERLGLEQPLTRERIRALMRKRCGVTPSESRNALHEMLLCRHCGLPFLAIRSRAEAGRGFVNYEHYQEYHTKGTGVDELPLIVQREEQRDGREVWPLYVIYPATGETQRLEEYTAELVLGHPLDSGERVALKDGDYRNMDLSNILVWSRRRKRSLRTIAKRLKRDDLFL